MVIVVVVIAIVVNLIIFRWMCRTELCGCTVQATPVRHIHLRADSMVYSVIYGYYRYRRWCIELFFPLLSFVVVNTNLVAYIHIVVSLRFSLKI